MSHVIYFIFTCLSNLFILFVMYFKDQSDSVHDDACATEGGVQHGSPRPISSRHASTIHPASRSVVPKNKGQEDRQELTN
jgi:hypothetical protein